MKILAVDDSRDNLTTLRAVLSDALPDCQLVTALDGLRGLALARAEDPDAILLDIVMPDLDGFEVCRRLKAEEGLRDIPVVFLTALRSDRVSRVKALEAGGEAFLSKPLDEHELVAQLRAMVKLKGASRLRRLEKEELAALVAERTRELERELAERKRTEGELQAQRDNQRAFFAAAPVPIFVLAASAEVVQTNPATERLFGRPATCSGQLRCGDVIGCVHRSDSPLGCGSGLACLTCALFGAAKEGLAGRVVRDREVSVEVSSDAAPARRWLIVHAEPLMINGGQGAVLALHDISAVKRALQDSERLQVSLAQSDRLASLGALAAGVAHEINNPLAYVLSNITYATDELRTGGAHLDRARLDETIAALGEAFDGAQRVRRIVRDLKMFSRPENEGVAKVNVEQVLESTINMANNEIRHRAQLVREFAGVPPIDANDSRLGQVFLNLLVNAAQAIPEGHASQNEIRVTTRLDPRGRVRVDVKDSGSGIPAEILGRIFDPFFTTKPVGVGTGLGLAICHGLITGLGGEISVESTVGRGTTFSVYLPVAKAKVDEAPAAKPVVVLRRGRVLVVDDEPMVGKALVRMLGAQHQLTVATRAREVLEQLTRGERFDVIVCDLMMPDISGMELHAEVLRLDAEQARRMVFATGGAFSLEAREFLEKVPNLRLDKPFDLGDLQRALLEHLGAAA
jgi:signal transduction histidine kinase/DNA-binding response OmpR family regulator